MVLDAAPGQVRPTRLTLNWGRALHLSVLDLGLACCAVEVAAAATGYPELLAGTDPFGPGPREAQVLVVAGTVTDAMAPDLLALWQSLPPPRYAVSVGACSNSGGPYWDSYCVTKGVDQLLPVDLYVPGCPPRPEALLAGLASLARRLATV